MLPRLMERSAYKGLRGLALLLSNRLRHSRPLVRSYQWVVSRVIPALFAALVVVSPISLINRISFKIQTDIGVCNLTNSAEDDPVVAEGERIILLSFSSVCQPAQFKLVKGDRYTVWLVSDLDNESDFRTLSDEEKAWRSQILQLPKNSPLPTYNAVTQIIAFPFKRVFSERFFTVLALNGHEEYVVDSDLGVTFTARDDALFLYLNNVVVGVPGLVDAFYYQKGEIKVYVGHESDSR